MEEVKKSACFCMLFLTLHFGAFWFALGCSQLSFSSVQLGLNNDLGPFPSSRSGTLHTKILITVGIREEKEEHI